MAIYFADSSALLKRYRKEVGSARVLDLLEKSERTFISRLGVVEVSGALTRRAKTTNLPREDLLAALSLLDADLAQSIEIIELDRPIMEAASFSRERMRFAEPMPFNWHRRCLRSRKLLVKKLHCLVAI